MKKMFAVFVCTLISLQFLIAQVSVTSLLTENLSNPLSIDVATPRLSWQLASSKRNVLQAAYECKVMNGKKNVWSSGKILSSQSVMIPYGGSALQSGKQYTCR